ncbi:MAG: rhodanese-like domain-containing protein [Ignavibacteriaceae bacterium]
MKNNVPGILVEFISIMLLITTSCIEVNSNLNSYLIIDIRPSNEFTTGHIENSVNIAIDSLFDFVEEIYNSGYPKIILVSKNGQSAAYYACLLKLGGFNNVYSLGFGLASWNEIFADEWLSALGNDPEIQYYNNVENFKNDLCSLPDISFENPGASLKDRVNLRIKKIISEGFIKDVQFQTFLPISPSEYLICYGNTSRLYFARSIGPLAWRGHHDKAIFYKADPKFELRSTDSLQTLPNNSPILIYDELIFIKSLNMKKAR